MAASKTYTRINDKDVIIVTVMTDGTVIHEKVSYNFHIDGDLPVGQTAVFQFV